MPWNKPDLSTLLRTTECFSVTYSSKRQEKDTQRFFGSVRPETKNPTHAKQILDIEALSKNMSKNLKGYGKYDQKYSGHEDHVRQEKQQLFRNALCSMLFIQLKKIQTEYDNSYVITKTFTNIKESVAANMILSIFNIDSFHDVPEAELNHCLQALKEYLNTMKKQNQLKEIINNETLFADLDTAELSLSTPQSMAM